MPNAQNRGGASVGVLMHLEPWEADLIVTLRLWCSTPDGQARVWNEFAMTLPKGKATGEMRAFEELVSTVAHYAHRPLVRHSVGCACIGADEGVFAHLVRVASEGDLGEAAQVATLLVTAAQAERVALLAAQVGCARKSITRARLADRAARADNVIRLH
ncbi:hypothetical protein [Roseobacter sinensis]|nr:hypothetical protein [Roseobacter sp. WL0113]